MRIEWLVGAGTSTSSRGLPPAAVLLGFALMLPSTALAEVCDKSDCGSATQTWALGVIAVVLSFGAWSWRLWCGAIVSLPLLLAASWNAFKLFGGPIVPAPYEVSAFHAASAQAFPLVAVAASVAGACWRLWRSGSEASRDVPAIGRKSRR